jgi:hypothetical protein
LRQTLQRHGPARGIADQALQLIAPVRGDLRVGVEGKPVDAGTAGTGACGRLACGTEAGAEAPDFLASPLAKGEALLHGGCQGPGQLGRIITQGIMPRGRHVIRARLQVSQPPQRAEDATADLLDHGGDVGIAGRLGVNNAWLEALVGAIEIDPREADAIEMEVHIERTSKALHTCDRSRLHLSPWDPARDRLVDIILADRGANNGMDLRGQLLGRGHPIP